MSGKPRPCKNSNQAVLYNTQRLWPPGLLNRLDKGFGFSLIICTMHHFKRGCKVQRGALQSLHGAVKTRRLISSAFFFPTTHLNCAMVAGGDSTYCNARDALLYGKNDTTCHVRQAVLPCKRMGRTQAKDLSHGCGTQLK